MQLKNTIYQGVNNRESVFDLSLPNKFNGKLILFLHGYKGFKDWGCWNLMGDYFLNKHYGFCKFNFSHNGGTVENPIDFDDLEAFGQNRYSYELQDTSKMINLVYDKIGEKIEELILVGHSRGGGIATLSASDKRVSKLVTLASIADIKSRFLRDEELKTWKENGVYYVKNGRTKQKMPHYYSFFQDYLEHEESLNILETAKKLTLPCLHIHGAEDTSVLPSESERLANLTNGTYLEIKNTDHTFGAKHPWTNEQLPTKMQEICRLVHNWIKKQA